MIIKKIALAGICFSLGLLPACESPFDPGDLKESRMAISATCSPTQGFLVFVSPVTPLIDHSETDLIENATVNLYSGGQFLSALTLAMLGDRKVFYSAQKPQDGFTYTLEIEAPGYISLDVSDRQPGKPDATLKGYTDLQKLDLPEGDTRYVAIVEIEINDRPIESNFYHLFLEAHLLDANNKRFFTLAALTNAENNDASLTPYVLNQSLLVDGNAFDGLSKRIKVRVEFSFPAGLLFQDLQMDMRQVSPAYYQFHKSHIAQLNNGSNPVAEPFALYTNVNNGYGFFGGFNSTRDTLTF
jgi:hypothetical protein